MKTVFTLRKMIVVLPGAVLFYLLQACVMGYFPIDGVVGNILWAYLAVVIVSCGKNGAFCAAAIIGMLMEAMLSSVNGLYIICYPLITMAWAQVFADMTDRQRERRATLHPDRRQTDLNAPARIALAAACMALTMNVVQMMYVYLSGISLTFGHFYRAFLAIAYTVGLAMALMMPLRIALGMYRRPKPEFRGGEML